jgi:2-C-methyl-D-erythritol 4-phosphate cytidylyltransferase
MNDIGIIYAAGGSGSRYQGNKLFAELGGEELFLRSIRNFMTLCPPEHAVLVVPEALLAEYRDIVADRLPEYPLQIVAGGAQRTDSVRNGLKALPEAVRYVAVHDAARPMAGIELFRRCLEAARECGGAIPGKPVSDTIKKIDKRHIITETVDRSELWSVETPQIFSRAKLADAYRRTSGGFTDDAGVMAEAGYPVKMVHNPDWNLKITYPEDLRLLQLLEADRRR